MQESTGIWDGVFGAASALAGAGAGAYLADFLGRRRLREQRLDEERAHWRDEAATVLAQVRALLEDFNFKQVEGRGRVARAQLNDDLRPRWSEVQQRMLRIVAVHPSGQVRKLTWDLFKTSGDHVTYILQYYSPREGRHGQDHYMRTDERTFFHYYDAAEKAWNNLKDEVQFKDVREKPDFSRSDYYTDQASDFITRNIFSDLEADQLAREKQSQEVENPKDQRGNLGHDNEDAEEGNPSP